jgi:ribokinase
VASVGRDRRGSSLIAAVANEGVHVSLVVLHNDAETGAAVIQVDERGQKQILVAPGANRLMRTEDVHAAREAIASSRILLVQLEVPIECIMAAARIARGARTRIVLDPAPAAPVPDELVASLACVRGNKAGIETLTDIRIHDRQSAGHAAAVLLSRGVEAVIVEVDEQGDLLVWQSGEEWLPRLPVKVVDATGAGDAFSAAVAVALAEGRSFTAAGRLGCAAAALATTKLGAQAGLPRRFELQSLLDELAGHHETHHT